MISDRLFSIEKKIIVLTGGSGFLGQNYIKFFRELHATVINFDIHHNPSTDITNEEEVKARIESLIKKHGRIDVLINNASLLAKIDKKNISKKKQLDYFAQVKDYPLAAFRKGLEVDLVGSFIVSKHVFPIMKRRKKGIIINIGSVYGINAPDQKTYQGIKNPLKKSQDIEKPLYYSVSKAGMRGLTMHLASYGAPEIRVNQLSLGGIRNQESSDFAKRYSKKTMLGRMGRVKDVYGALLFLASDASSYVTGVNLVVDGGFTSW